MAAAGHTLRQLRSVAIHSQRESPVEIPRLRHLDRVCLESLPEKLREFILAAKDVLGGGVAIVGGAVRDSISGKDCHDFDITGITALTRPERGVYRDVSEKQSRPGFSLGPLTISLHGARFSGIQQALAPLIRRLRRPSRRDRRLPFVLGQLHGSPVEHNNSLAVTPGGRVLRALPGLSIDSMALTSDGVFLDPSGGRRDIRNRIARIVGPLDRFTPYTLIRLFRYKHSKTMNTGHSPLSWDRKSQGILKDVARKFSQKICAFRGHTRPRAPQWMCSSAKKMFLAASDRTALLADLKTLGMIEPFREFGVDLEGIGTQVCCGHTRGVESRRPHDVDETW